MPTPQETTFDTSDTSLTAYLIASGIDIYPPQPSNSVPVIFSFHTRKKRLLETLLSAYKDGSAACNVMAYERARRRLIAVTKGKPWIGT